jgi:hypothetical protein
MVAADDVAPPSQHHRLGFLVGLLAPLHRECNERLRIVEHLLAHQLSVRSRSCRASNSAMVSALIMPRKRRRRRSITGIRSSRRVTSPSTRSPVAVRAARQGLSAAGQGSGPCCSRAGPASVRRHQVAPREKIAPSWA